ncbi:MAG: translocation/assembly module TamB domain-containing protein, partial [Saprospiraceae bacterium]|nr:translocation/assembly module TamB domain-containing protein [Saprospiraceae bacterium]
KITGTSRVIDGVGLTGASADARLEAKIDSLFFRNYQYKNLTMEGKLNKNLFDGDLTIQDDNIDLEFKGSIDFTESEPTFRFGADIRRLDLYRLNLIGKDYVVSGTVDLNLLGADLAKIRGRAAMSDLTILHQGNERYEVDSIVASSAILADGQKRFTLQSDLFQAELQGRYDLADLPETFLQFFERNYPIYARKLIRDSAAVRQIDSSRFTFELQINDTKGLTQLVHPKLGDLPATRFSGFVDTFRDSLAFDLEMPLLTFGNLQFEDVVVLANFERNVSDLDLAIFSTRIGSKTELAPIKLLSDIQQDTVNFSITAHDFNAVLNKLELDGRFFPLQEEFIIQFAESDLVIWNSEWHMKRNNFLLIGKNEVRTRNFVLNNGDRQVVLESIGNRGLYCDFRHFELGIVNDLWEYPPLDFAGAFDLEVKVEDIFEMKGISFSLEADTLRINSDDWGGLRFDAQAASLKSSFETFLTVTRPDQQLLAEGYYNPPSFEPSPGRSKRSREANYFDLDIHVASYPARILEYWIGSGISKTVGSVDGQVRLYGPLNRPNIEGEALLLNAATTIDYLNTRYSIERHQIHIDNELFDLKGAEIRDERGKTAVVSYGGITHDHLKNLGVNVTVKARDFLMLNTQKGQNELYYGTAIGTGDIRFTGSFQRTDIYVQARSEAGTRLVIPASSGRDASEVRFIRFSEKKLGNQGPPPLVPATQEITGVRIDMDLDITDDALVEIVFDEQAGDILRGRGNGTLQIVVTRTFDFFMYGEYVVSSGDYLFTLMNLVNKPFEVKPNGTIRWSGDPYGAQIDIEAQYKDLKASLTNFIAEYLISAQDETKSAARLPTDVDLTMKLTGQLLNPDINFGIQFPKLTGELKNYSDSKLRVLRQDQNEMNRQVFGLIVIGQFLPSDSDFQGNRLGIGINTLTEMLSQQLSLYLTGLVSEWLTEDGLISGIDFDIAYNYFQSADVLSNDPNQLYRGNELQVRLKNYLFDDRLTVNVGGNFDLSGGNYLGADPNSGAYFAGDLVIEYILTKDKNLKIRFYQSTEPEIGGGRRNKTGLGLSYRKEFDTFSEFLKGLRFTTKKLKEGRDRD